MKTVGHHYESYFTATKIKNYNQNIFQVFKIKYYK